MTANSWWSRSWDSWWNRELTRRDRVGAIVVGVVGGFWLGLLCGLFLGADSLKALGYWASGSAVLGAVLGKFFPRIITLVLFPFSMFGIG